MSGSEHGISGVPFDRFEHVDLSTVEATTPLMIVPGVVYQGWSTNVYGVTGSGKSMLACAFALEAIRRPLRVGHWDEEMGAAATALRYRMLGAKPYNFDHGPGRPWGIRYHEWQGVTLDDSEAFARHVIVVDQSDLVIFDPLADHLQAAGLEENANDDVTRWYVAFPQALTKAGVSSLVLDGTPHEGGHARGASQKGYKAALVFEVVVVDPPRADHVGRVRLVCQKDRFGTVGRDTELDFDLGGDGQGRIVFRRRLTEAQTGRPSGADRRAEAVELVADAVVEVVRRHDGSGMADLSTRQILDRLPTSYGTALTLEGIRRAVDDPLRPVVAYDGPRNARLHRYRARPLPTASETAEERSETDTLENGPSTVSALPRLGGAVVEKRSPLEEEDE